MFKKFRWYIITYTFILICTGFILHMYPNEFVGFVIGIFDAMILFGFIDADREEKEKQERIEEGEQGNGKN